METSISSVSLYGTSVYRGLNSPPLIPQEFQTSETGDQILLGKDKLSNNQIMNMVVERSMDKLRAVVDDARAALGLSENDTLDTSPEATANRIADFALNFYDKWRENHAEGTDEDARKQYASFIGGAIQQGIGEARDILGALNAMNSNVSGNIDKTWEYIQARLDKFIAGE